MWAQSSGNSTYCSVETEGFNTEPLNNAQIDRLADLYAWGHRTHGWPLIKAESPGQPGFGWHGMGGSAWGGHTSCPGNLRLPQRDEVLRRAGMLIDPSNPGEIVNGNAVSLLRTKSGNGYLIVANDGGVFAYGDAPFCGSMGGQPMNAPITGAAMTSTGHGYVLVGTDGGIFCFGDAHFCGSMGGKPMNAPIVNITMSPSDRGYWLLGADGGVFAFGDAPFCGARP
jgi:hypothetical protein